MLYRTSNQQLLQTGQNQYIARSRFGNESYILDAVSYQQIMDYVSLSHESIYLLPNSEQITAERLVNDHQTIRCSVSINQLILD